MAKDLSPRGGDPCELPDVASVAGRSAAVWGDPKESRSWLVVWIVDWELI